jgi:riboflavin kinase/FMN adenylyltransferase
MSGTAVTVGTFDGVHVGHRALIGRTVAAGRAAGAESAVVTWDRHPAATLRPDAVPALLTTQRRKLELLAETGVDWCVVLAFDTELSRWPPERFATEVLARGLGARSVVVSTGWRFGRRATGDVALLESLGRRLDFRVDVGPLVTVEGGEVSSSRVRAAVASGDLRLASALLGRPHELPGTVVAGDGRGASLGYPTANLDVDAGLAGPPTGIYACRARLEDRTVSAAVSVGVNPTFGGEPGRSPVRVEAHLLGFEGDLYGRRLTLELVDRLRDERRFDSTDALIAQMTRDVEATQRLIGR